MIARLWQRLRGTDSGVTVPAMDGALRPNTLLQEAPVLVRIDAPDNLVRHGGNVLCSSGAQLRALGPTGARQVDTLPSSITALAATDDRLALALDHGELRINDTPVAALADIAAHVTAMCWLGETLFLSVGSHKHPARDWKRDLMEHNANGALYRFRNGQLDRIASGLRHPSGLCATPDGASLLVSEAWSHRLLTLPIDGGRMHPVLEDLPGYPGRLVPAADGYWLCLFAPRSQLVAFVLKEDQYRADMMRTLDPAHWVCPDLSSGRDFLAPTQLGSIRVMGQIKPWAPTRSYGLVVRLDSAFQPVASAHSRADGDRHGVTSVIEQGDALWVASKGGDLIAAVARAGMEGDR